MLQTSDVRSSPYPAARAGEGAIMEATASQLRAARALLDWSREELAHEARISRWTVIRLETDDPKAANVSEAARRSVILALYEAGVEFTENDGIRRRKP
jgi:DNA-binding XRE family transcriptional regulator